MIDADGALIPLTDKTARTTQACIDATIGLDFETFVNSAFVRQGNANEFSKRSPKDRKEIITAILGLQSYDTLRKAAFEKIREATMQKATYSALQEKIKKDLESVHTIHAQTATLDERLNQSIHQLQLLTHDMQQCAQEKQILSEKERTRDAATAMMVQSQNSMLEQINILRILRVEWRAIHHARLFQDDPATLEEKKIKLVELLKQCTVLQQQSLIHKEKILGLKEALQLCVRERELLESAQKQEMLLTFERLKAELHTIDMTLKRFTLEEQKYQEELGTYQKSLDTIKNELLYIY